MLSWFEIKFEVVDVAASPIFEALKLAGFVVVLLDHFESGIAPLCNDLGRETTIALPGN
jgi:hypothetical protein